MSRSNLFGSRLTAILPNYFIFILLAIVAPTAFAQGAGYWHTSGNRIPVAEA